MLKVESSYSILLEYVSYKIIVYFCWCLVGNVYSGSCVSTRLHVRNLWYVILQYFDHAEYPCRRVSIIDTWKLDNKTEHFCKVIYMHSLHKLYRVYRKVVGKSFENFLVHSNSKKKVSSKLWKILIFHTATKLWKMKQTKLTSSRPVMENSTKDTKKISWL